MIEIDIQKELEGAEGKMMLSLNFSLKSGKMLTLYGESGAGKTSTLRLLAGLMQPDSGKIRVNGTVWYNSKKGVNISPQKRKIGYVFQDYALFPNMTVRKNLEFALNKNDNSDIVSELIEIIELGELQNRKPETLSGGQKQRVALARALVQKPEILLLDEPLAALDRKIRIKLQDYIQKVHQEFQLTSILISHDIAEVIKLSDWVFKLEKGKIVKQGKPLDIFLNKELEGKFKLFGEVLNIEHKVDDFTVSVLIQNTVVPVKVPFNEGKSLFIGDKVIVASEAFNPVLFRI